MTESIVVLVRAEFDKKNRLTLDELYEIIAKNPNIGVDLDKLKHRIRSTLYSLQKSNSIKWISRSTYEKI